MLTLEVAVNALLVRNGVSMDASEVARFFLILLPASALTLGTIEFKLELYVTRKPGSHVPEFREHVFPLGVK
jgi:hypothetical protein